MVVAGEEEHMRTVGELADLAGVTVRTLHHYDEIGLLSPSARSPAGYRLYDEADLLRLRQILFYRELDFPLDDIAAIVADKGVDAGAHLRRQHACCGSGSSGWVRWWTRSNTRWRHRNWVSRLPRGAVRECSAPITAARNGPPRPNIGWGDTDAWSQSNRRTSAYPKEDWLRIKAEADGIEQRFAELLRSGAPADGAGGDRDRSRTPAAHRPLVL